jgi:hypothetical protein
MYRLHHLKQTKAPGGRWRLKYRLVYLPGAVILAYGLWLSLAI